MISRTNKFIAFEGIDGAGKSTQLRILSQRLAKMGQECHETAEPTSGMVGSLIRQIMSYKIEADNKVTAGLFVADRLDHLLNESNGILEKVKNGVAVLTDRYYFSSYAYQGIFMPMEWVIQANALSAEILRPTVNIFIDVNPKVAAQRINNRRDIELYETLDTLTKIREQYFIAFETIGKDENVIIVDGNQSLEKVADDIWEAVADIFTYYPCTEI